MTIAYLTNASEHSGVGHRATMIAQHLSDGVSLRRLHFDGQAGELRRDGAVVATLPAWLRAAPKSVAWMWLALAARTEMHDVDLVHATNQSLSFAAASGTPYVVTVHDLIELDEPQTWAGSLLARWFYRGIAGADHVISVSAYTVERLRERYQVADENVTVIHNGVDSTFHPIEGFTQTLAYQELVRELRISPDAPVVLMVGSDHPRKNSVGGVAAFASVLRTHPTAVLVKVGAPGIPAGREQTLQAVDQHGVRDQVRFLDNVSNERLNELYNLASVLLFPSRLEGFGLPPLQAMAAGTPVVASSASSVPEVVGDAALLADPDEVTALAEQVDRVLADASLRATLRERGLARARQFSWMSAAQGVRQVYQQVVS